jgi:hypothetical protein
VISAVCRMTDFANYRRLSDVMAKASQIGHLTTDLSSETKELDHHTPTHPRTLPAWGPGRRSPRAVSVDAGAIFILEKGAFKFIENRFCVDARLNSLVERLRSGNVYRAREHPATAR